MTIPSYGGEGKRCWERKKSGCFREHWGTIILGSLIVIWSIGATIYAIIKSLLR